MFRRTGGKARAMLGVWYWDILDARIPRWNVIPFPWHTITLNLTPWQPPVRGDEVLV